MPNFRISPRRERLLAIVILVLAAAWRIALAAQVPVMSRDGVVFCRYAESLGRQGAAWLRHPDAQQHPLFPALLLGGQRIALALGTPPGPQTWQAAGQVVCCTAGLCVVVLVGALAARLVVLLELPVDDRSARLWAMALAALLDLNLGLSADVMSDQVHLALYLGAVRLALPSWSVWRLALAGLASGLAFLTRQEGFLPAVAAVIALVLAAKSLGWRRATVAAAAVLVAFLAVAGPYWSIVGRFSTKKDPVKWFEEDSTRADQAMPIRARDDGDARRGVALAKLETIDVSWYGASWRVLYGLLRAGRVVVPLLALLPLIDLRQRWLDPRLVLVLACIGGHTAMVTLLLDRYGYLATRHLLVVVALLMPLAAMFVARLAEIAVVRRSWVLGVATAAVALGPLLAYAFRVPNGHERYLRDAARWLAENAATGEVVVSGSSGRRIAFYAGVDWRQWGETPEDVAGAVALLRASGRGYFALESGAGFERRGNDALLAALLASQPPGLEIAEARTFDADRGAVLHLLRFGVGQ
jgi:hypothetical protein